MIAIGCKAYCSLKKRQRKKGRDKLKNRLGTLYGEEPLSSDRQGDVLERPTPRKDELAINIIINE